MNRRSFLKSAALAAVAVPVVGLPAMPVAKAVPAKSPVWTIKAYRRCNPVLGSHATIIVDTEDDLGETIKELDSWGYRVMLYMDNMFIGHT